MAIFRFSILLIILLGCSSEAEYTFTMPENGKQLLAGDSAKTWVLARRFNNKTRMNMGDCFLSYAQTYQPNGTMSDNAGDNRDCGESLVANWSFAKTQEGLYYLRLEGDNLGELMNIEENFKLFKLLQLSDSLMQLQFYHKQFSNKTTLITDFYVPKGTKVEGRDFHW